MTPCNAYERKLHIKRAPIETSATDEPRNSVRQAPLLLTPLARQCLQGVETDIRFMHMLRRYTAPCVYVHLFPVSDAAAGLPLPGKKLGSALTQTKATPAARTKVSTFCWRNTAIDHEETPGANKQPQRAAWERQMLVSMLFVCTFVKRCIC